MRTFSPVIKPIENDEFKYIGVLGGVMGTIFWVVAVLKNLDFGGEVDTRLKRHEKLNYEKFFSLSLSPSKMRNLHWSFRWGYGEDFLSIAVKKKVVSILPPPLVANRVNNRKKQKL